MFSAKSLKQWLLPLIAVGSPFVFLGLCYATWGGLASAGMIGSVGIWGHVACFVASLVSSWIVVSFLCYCCTRLEGAILDQFKILCDPESFIRTAGTGPANLPSFSGYGIWSELAATVRQALSNLGRYVAELQHQRAAIEIRARRAVEQSQQIRTILDAIDWPIVAVNRFHEIVLANSAAQSLLKHSSEKEAETNEASAIEHASAEQLADSRIGEMLRQILRRKSSGVRAEEVELTDSEGGRQFYQATVMKLYPGNGDLDEDAALAVTILRPIADQKAIQKRHAEFLSAVSHEMKTPLASIRAYVELLADGEAEDDETREQFLGVINSQADRLQRLVENLLNMARIEAGVVQVRKESQSLNEILEEAFRIMQPTAEGKSLKLTSELSPLYLGVLVDRDLILQAAINLLSNAIKYTPPGGRVCLRSRLADVQVIFEVEDRGVGLTEEECQRVFEKFYRVERNRQMAEGTGLGLALVKYIVEDIHGGQLSVRSKVGAGSTFAVQLPWIGEKA